MPFKPLLFLATLALLAGPFASGVYGADSLKAGASKLDSPEEWKEFEEFCSTRPCRKDVDIAVRKADGSVYRIQHKLMPPAVQSPFVQVLPGETISAVPKFENGKFSGWRSVAPIDVPEATMVTVEFSQDDGESSMTAKISNRGSARFRIDMYIISLDADDQPVYTSSCPIQANSTNYELWPYPIHTLILRDVTILDESDPGVCK